SAVSSIAPVSPASLLARAAQDGDLEQLNELIADGAQVNEPASDGSTALLWATYQSYPEMVKTLLDAGADFDAANGFGVTPLLQASRTGDLPVIELLLDAGADIEAATLNGETPLMAASRAGSVASVRLLLERGSDPNAVEAFEGQSALMWAAAEGHTDVVGVLLDAGADPNLQARVNSLTERSTRTDFPTGGFTAAMWAARNGDEATLRRLAESGADLTLTNGDGATASMVAIINDRFDLAARMLDMGAEANDGSLYYAVLMRDATTDWLAKDGSRLRVDYPNELTALDLTRVLLEAGADPNKPFVGQMHSSSMCCDTVESGTPFYRAAIAADVAALELLVAHGADIEWTPENMEDAPRGANGNVGKSPLTVAMNGGKGVGMAGGPGDIREGSDPPFREQANREPVDAMRVLLEAGADPNRRTGNGSTLLHDAARSRKVDVVRLLAASGAELDALNSDGLTALDIAEGRRAEDARGPGGIGGGFVPPGAGFGNSDGPTQEDVAMLLRELMEAQGVPIVEHGVMAEGDDA
ncbi:MAG: ankyrin repeat domain-containing protein, partial [Gammaproteobacteria bacterium]